MTNDRWLADHEQLMRNVRPLPDLSGLRTPCYVLDEQKLEDNLKLLRAVAETAGCRILLAQKAFSMFSVYPLVRQYLDGAAASGLHEALLGHESFAGETHTFSPAFTMDEFDEILAASDHVIFNSFSQWTQFREKALKSGKSFGMRINPEHPTQDPEHALYDPCAPGSRLGVTAAEFRPDQLEGLSGLHFHCLCEQNADALEETLAAVEEKFGQWLPRMKWVNFGGGHHITRPDYDVDRLIRLVRQFRERYDVTVYLEPGEAIALNAGYLVTRAVDVVQNSLPIVILDTSTTCHMPDVLEMPYRPNIIDAGLPGERAVTVRLGGPSCLAGDVAGDYSFDRQPVPGDRLVFKDMAIYTMVKNTTFNGIRLPDIVNWHRDGSLEVVRTFGFADFKNRLS